ncbi:MAG: hypothetical protein HY535_04430 [Chloroflexi bacterium]|nr:hypothetical protein [Chloroflexota bacterium]
MSEETAPEVTGRSERRPLTLDQIARLALPGLGVIMPRISWRYWTLYYAAKQGNWALARFEAHEIRELMGLGTLTRPKYQAHLEEFVRERLAPIEKAIERRDWKAFEAAYQEGTQAANGYHEANDKPFIVWKLPDHPPPGLDLGPL